jgi:hypothetical protein
MARRADPVNVFLIDPFPFGGEICLVQPGLLDLAALEKIEFR